MSSVRSVPWACLRFARTREPGLASVIRLSTRSGTRFVFVVGLSTSTAAMRQPIGATRSNPQTREFLLDVMRDTVTVGAR